MNDNYFKEIIIYSFVLYEQLGHIFCCPILSDIKNPLFDSNYNIVQTQYLGIINFLRNLV